MVEEQAKISARFCCLRSDHEDRGDILFRNVGLSQNYEALQLSRQHHPQSRPWKPQIQSDVVKACHNDLLLI
jgi:hypothetical protein